MAAADDEAESASAHLDARIVARRGSLLTKALRSALTIAAGLLTNDLEAGPSALELAVFQRRTGRDVLRIVAGTPEEADRLLQRARTDLARMSVVEFISEWRPARRDGE
ncbi:hypothetical protein DEA06_05140 [Microbacterium sp. Gd 4-13]|uniref:hypothetical protein n=1 Tax=Microbacterium sp. Gd 4-13 TaxID=2173179 RepID=UPI000D5840BE|nr:hypothetical protein [Microbacterium sp. Gd 4-13]PVW05152.1 hypothetical protein DEA06_05140 [Microbacterium sp. Gd 4-13]